MSKVQFDSYVVGLITGKTVTRKTKDGHLVSDFTPNIRNKYLPLPMILSMNKDLSIQKCFEQEGIHPRTLSIQRNSNGNIAAFVLTDEEKKKKKDIIKAHNKELRAVGKNPKKHMNVASE